MQLTEPCWGSGQGQAGAQGCWGQTPGCRGGLLSLSLVTLSSWLTAPHPHLPRGPDPSISILWEEF